MNTLDQPNAAQVRQAQQEAAQALQASQQAASDARELARAMRDQPPSPPAPPEAPVAVITQSEGGPAVSMQTGGPVIVIDGNRYILDRSSGGPGITIEQAKKDFGESGTVQILNHVIPIVGIVFGCITLWVLVEAVSKFITKRAERRNALAIAQLQASKEDERFTRVESAIEAVAVEVERITEAQRFQTRLLTERAASLPDAALTVNRVAESVAR
jgi:hypothetical protein